MLYSAASCIVRQSILKQEKHLTETHKLVSVMARHTTHNPSSFLDALKEEIIRSNSTSF